MRNPLPPCVRRRALCATALLICALCCTLAPRAGLAQTTRRPQASAPVAVFVVSGEETDKSVDALVLINGRQFKAPPMEELNNERNTRLFAENYFRAGRRYRLTFGGGEAGSMTIKSWSEGCNSIHARADVETTVRLGGHVLALATSSETMGRRASARRAPDASERAAVLDLVKGIYRQRRTPANWLPLMQVTNLTATDLNGDGTYEMIGSFVIQTRTQARRDLFLIASRQGNGYRAELVEFQAYQLPPEQFDSSLDFVDQLDLDGDGTGEVVTLQHGFDAYGYSIYKKQGGRWRRIYSAAGDAC